MKPLLICIHVFYLDMWPQLQTAISHMIHFPHELFITTSHGDESFKQKVRNAFPEAKIIKVANIGYDVVPFITTLNQVNLDNFSYIVKLHTKRDVGFKNLITHEWRQALMRFAQSKAFFDRHIKYLETHPQAGMLAHYNTIIPNQYDPDQIANNLLQQFRQQNNWPNIKFSFVAGTMFIVRASIFKPLQQLTLKSPDFDQTNDHNSGLPHMFERLFGYLVYQQGYQLKDIISPLLQQYFYQNIILRHPILYRRYVSTKGRLIIKVMGFRIYNSRKGKYK